MVDKEKNVVDKEKTKISIKKDLNKIENYNINEEMPNEIPTLMGYMVNQEFIDEYRKLLILQYHDKPKAKQEITAIAKLMSKIFSFYNSFFYKFDLDKARGEQLDIIGKIVGISRNVPFVVPKAYFGFKQNSKARGFDDVFTKDRGSLPMKDMFTIPYDSLELDDYNYINFIKLKVAKNISSGFMSSGDKIGMQEAIINALNNRAYIVDRHDMRVVVYVNRNYVDMIKYLLALDLLTKGQGVKCEHIIIADMHKTLGFSNNPNALSFGDLFNPSKAGGRFADFIGGFDASGRYTELIGGINEI